jgi:hypothetical protein
VPRSTSLPDDRPPTASRLAAAGSRAASAARAAFVGRSPAASGLALVAAGVLAAAGAWVVGTGVGADALADRTVETLTAQTVDGGVVRAGAALAGLGTLAGLVGAGLVPAALLGVAPVFGAGVTRWGTEHELLGSTHVVPLSEAALDATGAAVVVGAPLALLGFAVGVAVRRSAGLAVSAGVQRT